MRRQRILATCVLAVSALLVWSSCTSTVTAPERPERPVTVHLLEAGLHAGLVLPSGDGRRVEYGYGSWNWYARNQDRWYHTPRTVLWPNQGTLGRRTLSPGDLAGSVYGGGRVQPIVVDVERVVALVQRLDGEFAAGGEPLWNPLMDMHFVRHPDGFWMFHDCHDEVAEWLRELGCEVSWAPIRGGLAVEGEKFGR